jgi:hypothetical protein
MDQLRSVAEVYRLLHGNKYSSGTNNFSTEGDGLLIKEDIEAAGGTFSIVTPTATAYCMSSKLNGSSDLYLCMDSTGKVTRSATATCSGVTCLD